MPEVVGYGVMPIIPSMAGLSAQMNRQLAQVMPAAGAKAGSDLGSSIAGGARSALQGLATATATAVTTATAVAGVAITKGWDRFTTIENAGSALTISLGSSAKAASLLGDTLDVVRGTPFSLDQFAAGAQQLAGMSVAASKIPHYLTAIGEASATQGKRANEMAGRLTTIFGQMAASGQVQLADIWRISDTGVNALGILANSFGVSRDAMKTMISEGAVPAGQALDALADGILNGSNGPAGATVALAGTMEDLRKTTSGAVQGMSPALARLGAGFVGAFSPRIVEGANGITDALDAMEKKATPWAEKLASSPAVKSVTKLLADLPDLIEHIPGSLTGIAPAAGAALSGLTAMGSGSIPILKSILPSINPVAAALVGLALASPEARDALAEVAGEVMPLAREVGDRLLPVVEDLSDIAGGVLADGLHLAGDGLKVVLAGTSAVLPFVEGLTGALSEHEEIVSAMAIAYGAWKLSQWGGELKSVVGIVDKATVAWGAFSAQVTATAAADGVSKLSAASTVAGAAVKGIGSGSNLRMIASGFRDVGKAGLGAFTNLDNYTGQATAGFAKMSTGLKNIATQSVSTGAMVGGALAGIAIGAAAASYALDKLHESGNRDAAGFLAGMGKADETTLQGLGDRAGDLHAEMIRLDNEIAKGSTNRFDDEKLAAQSIAIGNALEETNAKRKTAIAGIKALRDEAGLTVAQVEGLAKATGVNLADAFDESGTPSKELQAKLDELGDAAALAGKDLKSVEMTPEQIKKLEEDGKKIVSAMDAVHASFAASYDVLSLKDEPVDPKLIAAGEKAVDQAKRQVAEAEKAHRESGLTADETERTAQALADARDQLVDANRNLQDLRATDSPLNGKKIQKFYEDSLADAKAFSSNIQKAIEAGYDPAYVGRLLQAGPQQAGPILEQLVANSTDTFVDLVNSAESELASLNAQAVEMARLTQSVVNETGAKGQQMSKDLSAAVAISTEMMRTNGTATIDVLAEHAGLTVAEMRRVAGEFGLELGGLKTQVDEILGGLTVATGLSTGQIFGGGARAKGGPVWPGTWLVGEEGPELITIGGRGHVTNAQDTRSLMAAATVPAAPARSGGKRGRRASGPETLNIFGASTPDVVDQVMWRLGS
jgi:tape measure domain-containing protein